MSKKATKYAWMRPAAVGPHFVVCMAIGYFLGSRIDKWLGTDMIWSGVFIFLGIAAGFRNLFKELQLINEEEQEALALEEQEEHECHATKD